MVHCTNIHQFVTIHSRRMYDVTHACTSDTGGYNYIQIYLLYEQNKKSNKT